VSGLVSATYDPKLSALTTKETANTAKVSSLGTLTNGIDTFASALNSLIAGGTLFTQPTTSDSSVLTATAKAGASIGNLSASLEVRQTAQAQTLVSPYATNASAPIGQGKLMLAVGNTLATITIDATNDSLTGLARTINSANTGVTAQVVTDANGARLVMKGQTGAANGFALQADANAAGGLGNFNFGGSPMTLSSNEVSSTYFGDATTVPVGQGAMTLTTGTGTATITIDGSNDNLQGLADSITNAGVGLTGSVTTDPNGSYLVVKDANGGTTSFTLSPAAGAQAGLQRFAYGAPVSQMTQAQGARDAIVRMDGVDVTRASNTIDDLVDGVTLTLVSEKPGTAISLGATRPTAAIAQAVQDYVAAYNELKTQIDTATASPTTSSDGTGGALYGNASIREMQRQLSRLTSTNLTSGMAGPKTLAEIGVSTNRDGSLSVDTSVLNKQLSAYPDQVEAMFNPGQRSDNPLIKISSAMGATKPGTYTITGLTAAASGNSAAGTIAGKAGVGAGNKLYASVTSDASGLVIETEGDVPSATITVDLGLGGALQSIRDMLRASGGALDSLSTSLTAEKTKLASDRTTMEDAESAYKDRLTTQFSKMDTRVAAYKSIQSYLEQQVAVWTKSS
jgi:flagellar hook-associated protein 2